MLAAAPKKLASRFYQLKSGHPRLDHTCKGLELGSRKDARDVRSLRNQSAISYWNAGNGGGLGKIWPKPYKLRKAEVIILLAKNAPEERLLRDPRLF
jgi:hypothetical protein